MHTAATGAPANYRRTQAYAASVEASLEKQLLIIVVLKFHFVRKIHPKHVRQKWPQLAGPKLVVAAVLVATVLCIVMSGIIKHGGRIFCGGGLGKVSGGI